jgi:hypothetical protein
LPAQLWASVELVEQCVMIYPVEAFRDIGIQHVLLQMRGSVEDCFDGVMTRPPRSEPITVSFKPGFPLWFECKFD